MPARIAMIAMTTRSSISVNDGFFFIRMHTIFDSKKFSVVCFSCLIFCLPPALHSIKYFMVNCMIFIFLRPSAYSLDPADNILLQTGFERRFCIIFYVNLYKLRLTDRAIFCRTTNEKTGGITGNGDLLRSSFLEEPGKFLFPMFPIAPEFRGCGVKTFPEFLVKR